MQDFFKDKDDTEVLRPFSPFVGGQVELREHGAYYPRSLCISRGEIKEIKIFQSSAGKKALSVRMAWRVVKVLGRWIDDGKSVGGVLVEFDRCTKVEFNEECAVLELATYPRTVYLYPKGSHMCISRNLQGA